MRAIDTNVLVRLITQDDLKQFATAEKFVKTGAWVSLLALAETTWVLTAVYDRKPAYVATAIEMLLNHNVLTFQDPDVATAALATFRKRPSLSYSDCLLLELARKAGHLPLGTFDRNLGRLEGTEKL